MQTREVARMLSLIAMGDNRVSDRTAVIYWEQILPEWVTYQIAERAVIEHRRTTTDYLEPAHIIALAEKYVDEQIQAADRAWYAGQLEQPAQPVVAAYSPSLYFQTHPDEWAALTPALKKIFRNMWPGQLEDRA